MKWTKLSDEFPLLGDNVKILVTDGSHIYVMYEDHGELWFVSDTHDNEYIIMKKLTYWAFLDDVPFPEERKQPTCCNYIARDVQVGIDNANALLAAAMKNKDT